MNQLETTVIAVMVISITLLHGCFTKSLADSAPISDYDGYAQAGVNYDEYPVVVPKRTAVVLDRMMVALQNIVDEGYGKIDKTGVTMEPAETMALQRRGQQKNNHVYWRCFFNAVTCFRK